MSIVLIVVHRPFGRLTGVKAMSRHVLLVEWQEGCFDYYRLIGVTSMTAGNSKAHLGVSEQRRPRHSPSSFERFTSPSDLSKLCAAST